MLNQFNVLIKKSHFLLKSMINAANIRLTWPCFSGKSTNKQVGKTA
ncbi:hypothetical protein PTD2_15357 [Pseudoalteromonas tunicata D2]|uniref:Uncharacterized protein n=1 Tax=Pseudoalteromonas tunicata D2 TaxID=87626 RepID=A4CCY6_9GAMM|nr:hypothetical protein PTD2_15357 [Pseudoalteromonas tunicata D2]